MRTIAFLALVTLEIVSAFGQAPPPGPSAEYDANLDNVVNFADSQQIDDFLEINGDVLDLPAFLVVLALSGNFTEAELDAFAALDVNKDNQVNSADSLAVNLWLFSMPWTNLRFGRSVYDVNNDGVVNSSDKGAVASAIIGNIGPDLPQSLAETGSTYYDVNGDLQLTWTDYFLIPPGQ